MKSAIYVMTHKTFRVPEDKMYIPLHVGRKPWLLQHGMTAETLQSGNCDLPEICTYTGDDSGDNISEKNCYYSELTGMYWAWKNSDAEVIGTCHYRRYLLNSQGYMFTEKEILDVLADYDIITTKNLQLNFSYYEGFISHHKKIYLDETARVLKEKYPAYYQTFERLVHEKHTYFGNMLICRRHIYNAYCEWMFSVLSEVEKRVKVEEEDSYHRRIFGFISEFLQYVWITHEKLSVSECMVGMLGEKAEVSEVKQVLAGYFAAGDYEQAKEYFLEAKKARPDILMEASDVTGELHMCMEVIAVAGLEQQEYGSNLLERMQDFDELMSYCSHLNSYVMQKQCGEVEESLKQWRKSHEVTDVAENCALAVVNSIRGTAKVPV